VVRPLATLALALLSTFVATTAGASPEQRHLVLRPVVRGLDSPLYVTSAPGEPNNLYVVEQNGRIRVLVRGKLRASPFLNVAPMISSGGERGLLGLAFHPKYAKNRRLFVHYTDRNGDTRLVEYRSNGQRVLPNTRRVLIAEEQPYPNHNGGQLAFGPDGLLYIGLGDGGSGGDPHNNGQTFRNMLAKIWKLNVDRRGARPQLVGYGLRNPWRFSFDRATGDLYIGDVGQNEWEEIDYVARADRGVKNFGWAVYEGREQYSNRQLLDVGELVSPIHVYGRGDGCTVIGGYVYRGRSVRSLSGRYLFGDYCAGTIWSLRVENGNAVGVRREGIRVSSLSSFGEDARGELYAVSLDGTVYRIG
jgi:glucose/arabinose dehydrogenase